MPADDMSTPPKMNQLWIFSSPIARPWGFETIWGPAGGWPSQRKSPLDSASTGFQDLGFLPSTMAEVPSPMLHTHARNMSNWEHKQQTPWQGGATRTSRGSSHRPSCWWPSSFVIKVKWTHDKWSAVWDELCHHHSCCLGLPSIHDGVVSQLGGPLWA